LINVIIFDILKIVAFNFLYLEGEVFFMKMRLGCFGFVKDIDSIAKAGFDCIEMHYKEITPMSEGEFRNARKKLRDSPLTAEVFNNPLPLDKQIISPDFKLDDYRDYIKKGAERAAELGARFCNFGNGRTRSLPEHVSEAELKSARSKILECIAMICEINAEYNITVLLEPLSPVVSNFILNIPEAIALAKELCVHNLKTFIDLRWFVDEKRPWKRLLLMLIRFYTFILITLPQNSQPAIYRD